VPAGIGHLGAVVGEPLTRVFGWLGAGLLLTFVFAAVCVVTIGWNPLRSMVGGGLAAWVHSRRAATSLIARMKTLFGDEVRDVRTTEKLDESPACLGVSEGDMDPRMERFLLEHKQLPKRMSKILEINPRHPVITKLNARVSVADSAEIDDTLWLILDQARLAEGEPLTDAAAYARRVAKLMERGL
jgi:hypothetical protein